MTATNLTVTARKWDHGWELHFTANGVDGVTQSRSLTGATQQVRDYLDTVHGDGTADRYTITVNPELSTRTRRNVETIARRRLLAQKAADDATAAAAELAAYLRDTEQLSIADAAHVMGISKTRAAQLLADV